MRQKGENRMSMMFCRRLLLAALYAFLFGAEAGAEKIRTSVPGLNLNYLSIFSMLTSAVRGEVG